MDIITGALNEGYGVDVVYLDFIKGKTFDRVPHKRLIMKLSAVGISGNLLCWCSSFLSNRFQRVVMGDVIGDWMPVLSGVLQGSVHYFLY
jgi:hypothetical protein